MQPKSIILFFYGYILFFRRHLCILWFFAFQVVVAEWFGMWMSKVWKGLPDTTRLVTYMFLALIFISLKND
ncbi:DUF2165 family protein [Campylobacter jejuni]|nr:DUF2165 family protein [Campylobacter jejuni]ECC2360522.1 DUF2165 family protein [Campylobacter jejuni]ECK5549712.1 DUF2165 family protein [Campylobacter jejuni]ECK7073405.1 DUF2165 family protein [Campylobacter jejuni]EDO9825762.1 DUF2165 family protein [Campylobacter jejuni]